MRSQIRSKDKRFLTKDEGCRPRAGALALALCAVLLPAALAPRIARAQASAWREQTNFGLEEPVRRPAPIPADVLRGLGQDERVQGCLTGSAQAPVEIPAAWFAASAVHLNRDGRPDLIVQPANACLYGANVGPFWVFRHTGRGYALALRVDALGLDVLPTRTRGYRDIRARSASARRVLTRRFRFDGESYRASGR